MVASLMALNALAIDIMLPALPDIGADLGVASENDRQLIVVVYVAFFGISQLAYGPLTDAYGRRPVLITALCLYILGTVACVFAGSFELMLAARALQGVGAAATRVIATAVVRDLTSGRRMAQIMSMAMTVFMIIPIAAPGIGQLILFAGPWRWVFAALLFYGVAMLAWTIIRLPETHPRAARTPIAPGTIFGNYREILSQRQCLGYMIANTMLTSALFAYVTSSQQIYVDVYGLGDAFPLAFASVAIAMSLGTFTSSRLVMRLGMRRISHAMVIWLTAMAALHAALLAFGLHSAAWFMILLALTLCVFGMISGNFNAIAMEPVGRIAGSAASLYGAVWGTVGALAGGLIAHQFDGTALPFMIGLAVLGSLALAAVLWAERGRLFRDPPIVSAGSSPGASGTG